MKLNAAMIYEAVSKLAEISLLGTPNPACTLRFTYFYDGSPDHLLSGGIYLSESSRIPPDGTTPNDLLWVTWGQEPAPLISQTPVLFFRKERDPQTIMNLLQQAFFRLYAWEEQMEALLERGGSMQQMIDLCEPLFQHALCVADDAHNLLGYSACFSSLNGAEIKPLFYDLELDRIRQLRNKDCSLGTLYLLHSETPFTATELALFDLLAGKLVLALQNLSTLSGLYQNSFRHAMQTLFETKQIEEDQLYESLSQWGGQKGDTFVCYKVKASHIHQTINAEHICSIFENGLFGSAVAFWHDAVLVVLCDVTNSACAEEKIHRKMAELLHQFHLRAGVSLSFQDLGKAWYHFRQACCAFEEGYPVHPDETLYFFQDYVSAYMLHHAAGEFPKAYLLDSGLQRLVEHDKLYSVCYLDTLNAFFQCRMNMSQTAELLQIHRTSLNSRMQKIWNCLDHELTQEYLLYLQIILEFLKNSNN